MKPIVAIVGRPNVGKSTLFNRFIQRRLAIVEDTPGVTRDRIYAEAEWLGRRFLLVDTGGFRFDGAAGLDAEVYRQADLALAEADAILFVVDARTGLHPDDEEVAKLLRRSGKPVILAVNKAESSRGRMEAYEFYRLGLGEPVAVSAEHGINVGELLDRVVAALPAGEDEPEGEEVGWIRVAVIGRPNVGKSSLVNRLIGSERLVVSPTAGTTRDAIDVPWTPGEHRFLLVDTAGLRRKARVEEDLEYYSVVRTLRAVDRADLALVLIDATQGVTEQDKKVAGYAHNQGKGCILLINKWDLVEKETGTAEEFTREVRRELGFVDYAPILFTSALTGQRLQRLPDLIAAVAAEHARRIPTAELNRVVREAIALHQPPTDKGRRLRIYYATEVRAKPPTFVFFTNDPELVHLSYRRYLENRLRAAFGFLGTPLRLHFRARSREPWEGRGERPN